MEAISLQELCDRIGGLINPCRELRDLWVTAELSDVRHRAGGHCYLELIGKDQAGRVVQKLRATIWASTFYGIEKKFFQATQTTLADGMKVMLQVSVGYHPAYGLAANVTDINPAYTLGDLLMRRQEILTRLAKEGVLNLNKELSWPEPALRIAIISARDAAGYGDFVSQLYGCRESFRFKTSLFIATMQGEKAPDSIINALDRIAEDLESWDCVVIIRGGGATTDFAAFENYELAANIAQFPLPIIIGIGHERDVTLLDYVAHMRVKTPTAAAEWLIETAQQTLKKLKDTAQTIKNLATEIIASNSEMLATAQARLPFLPELAIKNSQERINLISSRLVETLGNKITPQMHDLEMKKHLLNQYALNVMERNSERLAATEQLLGVLSPEATLKRGYSITWLEGKALRSVQDLKEGMVVETEVAEGRFKSKICKK